MKRLAETIEEIIEGNTRGHEETVDDPDLAVAPGPVPFFVSSSLFSTST
jgi:hypothetical protein